MDIKHIPQKMVVPGPPRALLSPCNSGAQQALKITATMVSCCPGQSGHYRARRSTGINTKGGMDHCKPFHLFIYLMTTY